MRSPAQLFRDVNAFRRRQRELLEASNHPRGSRSATAADEQPRRDAAGPGAGDDPGTAPAEAPTGEINLGPHGPFDPMTEATAASVTADAFEVAAAAVRDPGERGAPGEWATARQGDRVADGSVPYGLAGLPFDRHSPFYFGFLATLGAMIAWTLFRLLGQLTTTMTILLVAFFLTLALDPIVAWLAGRGLRRAWSVVVVFSALIAAVVLVAMLVVPVVTAEGSALLNNAPDYFSQLLTTPWLQELDQEYEVIQRAQEELTKRVQDGSLVAQIFGGVLGAGRAVASGIFQLLTILILTLYFLATLPRIKQAAYSAVPASRRPRVVSLSEEIMRRIGAYAAGQGLVATVNGICSFIFMSIVGIPYAAVLAVVVGLLGLVPMVGATLGAVLVGVVAFFHEPRTVIAVAIYYVVYQQLENYVVVPRIMASTVSVPGALTIVAALAGGTVLGLIGALLAIPIAAGLLLLYEEVLLPRQARH
ncbi:MAG: AI-2E family transporter [Actinomycetia bacterium]|nr:AI-2E family transporter [Actinomycetes bacterium]